MVVYEVLEDNKTGTLRGATESYSRGHQIKDVNNYKTIFLSFTPRSLDKACKACRGQALLLIGPNCKLHP